MQPPARSCASLSLLLCQRFKSVKRPMTLRGIPERHVWATIKFSSDEAPANATPVVASDVLDETFIVWKATKAITAFQEEILWAYQHDPSEEFSLPAGWPTASGCCSRQPAESLPAVAAGSAAAGSGAPAVGADPRERRRIRGRPRT